jgi:hypothetical protein
LAILAAILRASSRVTEWAFTELDRPRFNAGFAWRSCGDAWPSPIALFLLRLLRSIALSTASRWSAAESVCRSSSSTTRWRHRFWHLRAASSLRAPSGSASRNSLSHSARRSRTPWLTTLAFSPASDSVSLRKASTCSSIAPTR